MNTLQSLNLMYLTTIEPINAIKDHTNRKLFAFFVTATYSLVPLNVNTFISNNLTSIVVAVEVPFK